MVWNSAKLNGGFSEVKPWLPVKKEQKQKSVDLQEDKNDSVLSFYKEMIKARKNTLEANLPISTSSHQMIFLSSLKEVLKKLFVFLIWIMKRKE